MLLRPYQIRALETSRARYQAGVTRQLLALPTGTGKTVVFASLRDFFQFTKRMLVLVHREELAAQVADKIKKWNPGCTVGIEMGDLWAKPTDTFVVASVQTLGRANSPRLARLNPADFDSIICDEAHHSVAPSYKTIFDHFGTQRPDFKGLLLGVTATPNRGDGAALASVYDEIVYQMTILDAIRQGWLVDIRGIRVNTKTNLDRVRTRAGDFQLDDLTNEVNTPERNDLIAREWVKHGQDRQTIAFTTDIAHANDLAQAFKRYGVAAEAVWGTDPYRADKLRAHRAGHLRVLCNAQVLTEGYDDPNVGCIVLARPTKSNLLFVQMTGRGTRLAEGINNLLEAKSQGITLVKEDCILMDVVDNTQRHSLVTLSSIFGLGKNLDLKGNKLSYAVQKVTEAKEKHPDLDLSALTDINKLDAFVEKVNLFEVKYPQEVLDHSLLQWHYSAAEDAFVLLLPQKETVVITAPDLLGNRWIVGSVKGNKFKEKVGPDIAECLRQADSMVTMFGSDTLHLLRREAKWMDGPATDKQLAFLRRLKVPFPPNISKGDASRKINQALAAKQPMTAW